MHSFYRVALLAAFSLIIGTAFFFPATVRAQQPQQQRVVENVDIQGNRRLRKDDVLYYVQTRAGDTYSEAQVARDLRDNSFARLFRQGRNSRLYGRSSARRVECHFEVRELPIIRDIQFEGLKSVAESDVLKTFREAARRHLERVDPRSSETEERRARSRRNYWLPKAIQTAVVTAEYRRSLSNFQRDQFCHQRGRASARGRDSLRRQ